MRKILGSLLLTAALAAQAFGSPEAGNWLFGADLRLWGADGAVGWKGLRLIPGLDTVFWASAGGGYQSEYYFAGPDDAVLPADLEAIRYDNLNLDWRFGAAQGILFNRARNRNLLEALLLYRGKYHYYLDPNGVLAGLPDSEGLLQHSIFTGLVFDNVERNLTMANRRGVYAAAGVEFAPRVFGNSILGASDFTRFSLIACGYLPVLSSPALSIYLADQILYDHMFGEEGWIPQSARASFGALTDVPIGKNPLRALGETLRGVVKGRFDGYVKLANTADVRLHFPAWTLFDLVTPGLILFFDAGVSDHLSRTLRFDPVYCTTGIGLALYSLGYDLVLYGAYFINENRLCPVLELSAHF